MTFKILLIDDDLMINIIHRKIIGSFYKGCETQLFKNGLEAIQYVSQNENVNFLIFLDINMPVMDGWGVLEAIKEHFNTNLIQVVVLSSSIDIEDREKAKSYNFVIDFISKPLRKERLSQIQGYLVEL